MNGWSKRKGLNSSFFNRNMLIGYFATLILWNIITILQNVINLFKCFIQLSILRIYKFRTLIYYPFVLYINYYILNKVLLHASARNVQVILSNLARQFDLNYSSMVQFCKIFKTIREFFADYLARDGIPLNCPFSVTWD